MERQAIYDKIDTIAANAQEDIFYDWQGWNDDASYGVKIDSLKTAAAELKAWADKERQDPIQQKYLEAKGGICPFCGSSELKEDQIGMEDLNAVLSVHCKSCRAKWEAYFVLDGMDYHQGER